MNGTKNGAVSGPYEDPSHVAMWTNEEQTDLLEERRRLTSLPTSLAERCASLVAWPYR
jgi:hypothetical protein